MNTMKSQVRQDHRITLGITSTHGRRIGTLYPDGSAVVSLTIGDRPAELHLDRDQRTELIGALLQPVEVAVPSETDPDTHEIRVMPPYHRPGAHRRMQDTRPGSDGREEATDG
ncbi:hypothetical protein AB0I72_19415 [Nocardiopsis sp. NPDC049922]|uniref:hypothetical protein n=1 Tax=Nocardiopsis sp. NPDC049922 TaxID=3155157 RepID=UPI0033FDE279